MPRRVRWALVIGSLAVALGLVEVGLRSVGGVFQDEFTQLDPIRGWVLRPGFAGWMAGERTLWVRINSDGLRDDEHARAADPRTIRIAVLGDSYMQGLNVPLEHTFASFLERRVSGCFAAAGRTAEVINFGVSGYGTAQELLTYRHQAAGYAPDLVLLAVYTNNDIANNHRRLNPVAFPELSPYFLVQGDGLVDDQSVPRPVAPVHPWWRRGRLWLTGRSRVAQLLYLSWGGIRAWLGPAPADDAETVPADAGEASIYQPPASADLAAAWQVTEALLRELANEVAANGSTLWITTLANTAQITPDLEARRALERELGVDDLYYPDRRIRGVAEAIGVPVISLAEPMADYAARHRVHLQGGYTARVPEGAGHWNERGYQLAADLVGERICAAAPALAWRPRPRVPAAPTTP